ncbi:MAG: phosphatase [Clostridia bacterium]|nr:phosphatase [Clostridia bacterium]
MRKSGTIRENIPQGGEQDMKCGVIDLGSNTVRLAVFQRENGKVERLLNEQRNVGLAGYVSGGALSEDGIRAACRALEEYRVLLAAFGIPEVRVFATASLRNISNTAGAVAVIREKTGLTVDVLPGGDEAALSFRGTILSCPESEGLLADIGGGSTELVSFRGRGIVSACSLPFGSLSLFKKYVSGLFPTPTERASLRDIAAAEAERARGGSGPCKVLLGAGGTIQSAAVLAGEVFGRGADSDTFSAVESVELLKELQSGSRDALLRILHAVPDRVHTILPGLIILNAVIKVYGVETVRVSATDIRDGYFAERV